ncbi:hypothetical protein [Streptomyces sp. NPDC058279]|uniref:hypothetical protein n=1 Tax=Streptomyces sp. NPDC058279 TaxID=3346418 RepID=UPI0036DFEC26
MTRSDRYPQLFLDIDGPLIPFGGAGYPIHPVPGGTGGNPLLDRLDPALGPRLAALPCEPVWATTWGADANPLVGRRLGLPDLPVLDLPDLPDLRELPDLPDLRELTGAARTGAGGLHWKTRPVVAWAAGRPFVWVDDEITPEDRAWVAAYHPGPALPYRVDPRTGLTDADFVVLEDWLRRRG